MFPWSYDAAFLGCLISNIIRSKDRQPYSVSDFMPADIAAIDPTEKTWQNLRALAKETQHGNRINSNGKHHR
jgi:hypothetical protein